MPNYQKAKIYKLVNLLTNEILYIGSTCNTLNRRWNNHKSKACNYQYPIYIKMREIGVDNVIIELIELYPCNNKIELEQQETIRLKEYKALYPNLLNKNRPRTTLDEKKEYDSKRQKKQYQKYTKIVCDCGSILLNCSSVRNAHIKTKKHQLYLTKLQQ
jgi:hypothetical protein